MKSAKNKLIESVGRIEPTRVEAVPENISDVVAELATASAQLVRGSAASAHSRKSCCAGAHHEQLL
jgi:hypothetical protein